MFCLSVCKPDTPAATCGKFGRWVSTQQHTASLKFQSAEAMPIKVLLQAVEGPLKLTQTAALLEVSTGQLVMSIPSSQPGSDRRCQTGAAQLAWSGQSSGHDNRCKPVTPHLNSNHDAQPVRTATYYLLPNMQATSCLPSFGSL